MKSKRSEALKNKEVHYFTGKPCKNGHVDVRFAKDGACKTCTREKRARLYKINPEKSRKLSNNWKANNKAKTAKYMSEWREKNKAWVDEYSIRYRNDNREARLKNKQQWRLRNLDHVKEYARSRYAENLNHKLAEKIRAMVRRVAHGFSSKHIGYCYKKLKSRLECQFSAGMTWRNYGEWEIDHKIPVSKLLARGVTDPRIINALSNLQPLWKSQNRSKSNRYSG